MLSKIHVDNQDNIYIVYNASRKNILNEIFLRLNPESLIWLAIIESDN